MHPMRVLNLAQEYEMSSRILTLLLVVTSMVPVRLSMASDDKRPTDGMMKSMIEYRLIQEKIQKADAVAVKVQAGTATLQGAVESVAQRKNAERLAAAVPGITAVNNELKIDARGDMPDSKIAEAVASAIRSSVWFDIFDWVEGDVRNGVVTLKGAVREPWRRNEYGQLAEALRGVVRVDNQIKPLPLSNFDDQLRVRIAHAIYANPIFVRYANRSLPPIHIVVDNGQVVLKGAVNTELEKQTAGMIANQSEAFSVINDLQIDRR
jgi:osmotically-inducible protein OsmY